MARLNCTLFIALIFGLVQSIAAGGHGAGGGNFGWAGEYLALEMIENRCASQVGKFIKGSHLFTSINGVVNLGDTTGTQTPGLTVSSVPAGFPSIGVNPAALIGRKLMGRAVVTTGDVSEESYRKEVCTIAAGIVDQYCVGAPDDRGVTAVQTWLQALGCTAVVARPQPMAGAAPGMGGAAAGAAGGIGK